MSWSRRRLAALGALLGLGGVIASPTVAWADPPGPTDFESVLVGDAPPGIEVEIIGGDSFLQMTVDDGVEVHVEGYQREPFLEFLADGTVRENRASPSYWLSRSKDGAPVPTGYTADSPPEWVSVATDGTYAWHDHRSHLMGAPVGERGDVVADGKVYLTIDGVPTTLVFETTWLPAASPLPALVGAIAGLAAAVSALFVGRSVRAAQEKSLAAVGTVASAAAGVIGLVQFLSVPRVTGPAWSLWLLPATALLASLAALRWRGPTGDALRAVAGVELVLWFLPRRGGLTAAVLPTDAPFWLDRAVSAGAVSVGVIVAGAALLSLVATITAPPAPATGSA